MTAVLFKDNTIFRLKANTNDTLICQMMLSILLLSVFIVMVEMFLKPRLARSMIPTRGTPVHPWRWLHLTLPQKTLSEEAARVSW